MSVFTKCTALAALVCVASLTVYPYLLYKLSVKTHDNTPCTKLHVPLRRTVRIVAWIHIVCIACLLPSLSRVMLSMCMSAPQEDRDRAQSGVSVGGRLWYVLLTIGLPFVLIGILVAFPIVMLFYLHALDADTQTKTPGCMHIASGYRHAMYAMLAVLGLLLLRIVGRLLGIVGRKLFR